MAKWQKTVKYSSIAVEIIGVIIIVSIIYSGVMMEVGLVSNPRTSFSISNTTYTYSGYNFTIGTEVHIDNHGIYAIQHPEIKYYFIQNSTQLGNGTEILPDIIGNYTHEISIVMNVKDIIERSSADNYYLLFHSSLIEVILNISFYYGLDLLHFALNLTHNISFPNPVIYYKIGNYSISQNSSGLSLSMPITFNTATYLSGNASLNASLLINGTIFRSDDLKIPLGQNYSTNVTFFFTQSQSQYLYSNLKYMKIELDLDIFNLNIPLEVNK